MVIVYLTCESLSRILASVLLLGLWKVVALLARDVGRPRRFSFFFISFHSCPNVKSFPSYVSIF